MDEYFIYEFIFIAAIQLFFGVVVFGLFHGLAYLPVVLSCFGPAETASQQTGSSDSISTEFSSSPSSTSSDSSASTPVQKKHHVTATSALDNPIFIVDPDIQVNPKSYRINVKK